MEDYSESVVKVTGACGGIGESIVRKFAEAGASLGICDIRESELDQLAASISSQGVKVHHRPIDVTVEEDVREFCPDCPPELVALIGDLMQKNPADRPADALAVRDAVQALLRD